MFVENMKMAAVIELIIFAYNLSRFIFNSTERFSSMHWWRSSQVYIFIKTTSVIRFLDVLMRNSENQLAVRFIISHTDILHT